MTEVNKEELRRLAEAATEAPWVKEMLGGRVNVAGENWYLLEMHHDQPHYEEDAAFIAAANPAAILSLLDEADARDDKARNTSLLWMEENAKLRAEVESLRAQLKACHPFRPAHEPVTGFAPGCLVCGQYTDHGGLQCPKMRSACTAQEGSAND